MSRLASSKTDHIWAERIAQGERSNAPVAQRTQRGASLCPGLSHFAPLGRGDRWFIVRYPKPNSPKQARGCFGSA